VTRIHDHVTWCVFGVIQGVEHEELFDADLQPDRPQRQPRRRRQRLRAARRHPPRAQHRGTTAISIHIYGTDVTRIGSSVRRYYD
jgi:predicted metal-dependent enzyme (double-stranded beta helix superfamily)